MQHLTSAGNMFCRLAVLNQRGSCLRQQRHGVIATDRGKLGQKGVERITFFKVVEEVLNRDTGSGEHSGAALNIRVHDDQLLVHDSFATVSAAKCSDQHTRMGNDIASRATAALTVRGIDTASKGNADFRAAVPSGVSIRLNV